MRYASRVVGIKSGGEVRGEAGVVAVWVSVALEDVDDALAQFHGARQCNAAAGLGLRETCGEGHSRGFDVAAIAGSEVT